MNYLVNFILNVMRLNNLIEFAYKRSLMSSAGPPAKEARWEAARLVEKLGGVGGKVEIEGGEDIPEMGSYFIYSAIPET